MKIDWVRKLTSRKFWVAVAGFVTAVLTAFNIPDLTVQHVSVIVGALGVLAVFIFSESITDKEGVKYQKGNNDA